MTTSISSVLVGCLRLFNALISRNELASYAAEVPTNLWADELGRLRVWAANIGAHQTGQSSLDYRLRDASHIKGQTVKLLEQLRRTLEDVDELLGGVDEDDEDLTLHDDDETESQQIYRGLVTTVDCLFQMSMVIRRPTQHDRLLGTKKLDTTAFEPFDKQHVAHKYPQAHCIIVDRLGRAISRRRAALKYHERHHAKLQKGIDHIDDDQPDAISARLSETIATDFEEPHIDFEETISNSGASQTSYATSLWESSDKIIVPYPPKESSGGKPFECPYCFFVIKISDRRSWTRHVFRDLMPYICVFPDCSTSHRLYDSRHEWFQHLRTRHMSVLAPGDDGDCPLHCGMRLSAISIERHLGKHLEELALFALPRTEEGDERDSNHSQRSAVEAKFGDNVSSDPSEEVTTALSPSTSAQATTAVTNDEFDNFDSTFDEPADDHNEDRSNDEMDMDSSPSHIHYTPPVFEDDEPPDIVHILFRGDEWFVSFPPFSIAEEKVRVSHVRDRVARVLGLDGQEGRVVLIYKNRELKRNDAPLRKYGCKQNSEISVVVTQETRDYNSRREISSSDTDSMAPNRRRSKEDRRPSRSYSTNRRKEDEEARASRSPSNDRHPHSTPPKINTPPRQQSPIPPIQSARHPSPTVSAPRPTAPAAPPPRADPSTGLGKIQAIRYEFLTEWYPLIDKFIRSPPTDRDQRIKEYLRLKEIVYGRVFELGDAIELDGPDTNESRSTRKQLYAEAQGILKELDKFTPKWE